MASFPGYTIVSGTKFQIHHKITITPKEQNDILQPLDAFP